MLQQSRGAGFAPELVVGKRFWPAILLASTLGIPWTPLRAGEVTVLGTITIEEELDEGFLTDTAAAGGKVEQLRRDIPLSVSVLTRGQMDQQNMVTTWDALQQIPGVTAVTTSTASPRVRADRCCRRTSG